MSAPKSRCPDCLEPLTDCLCIDDNPSPAVPAVASGLTVLRVRAEGGDDPIEPDPGLYHVES